MRGVCAFKLKPKAFAWLDETVRRLHACCVLQHEHSTLRCKDRKLMRRTDNHMINGTKLLNVAGMTRGRRDGILKSEKLRHVVKIGPMHLKGVWWDFKASK